MGFLFFSLKGANERKKEGRVENFFLCMGVWGRGINKRNGGVSEGWRRMGVGRGGSFFVFLFYYYFF